MKRLLLASLFFLLPVAAFAVPTKPEQFEKLENEFSLECQKYGAESCAARFISMSLEEQLERIEMMTSAVESFTVQDWAEEQIKSIDLYS